MGFCDTSLPKSQRDEGQCAYVDLAVQTLETKDQLKSELLQIAHRASDNARRAVTLFDPTFQEAIISGF